MKQIVEIIKDCRRCPNYGFRSSYPGGIEFVCHEIKPYDHRLIPHHKLQEIGFIHDDCPLGDKE